MSKKENDRNRFTRIKPPYIAKMNEVIITKGNTSANIEYKEKNVGGVSIEIGPEVVEMTDREILDQHNKILLSMMEMELNYEHIAKEIPLGKPQIEYSEKCQQWVPRGDVLRCVVGCHNDSIGVEIDDRFLDIEEFGRMLQTFEGWGMRITFVPQKDIFFEPKTKLEDPDAT